MSVLMLQLCQNYYQKHYNFVFAFEIRDWEGLIPLKFSSPTALNKVIKCVDQLRILIITVFHFR